MRKLTKLATTILTAAAFLAVAAPANADQPFVIEDPIVGGTCDQNPGGCTDTGYQGTFQIRNTSGQVVDNCYAVFDIQIDAEGALTAYNPSFPNHAPYVDCYTWNVTGCGAGNQWPGQVRIPDTGPAQIDFEICNDTGWIQYHYDMTFTMEDEGSGRTWTQLGASNPANITNAQFGDGNSNGDNFIVTIL